VHPLPDDQEQPVAPELDNPAIEPDEQQAVTDDNQTAPEDAQEEQTQEPEDDSEEFDWNGKKVRGPKGLKDGVLMHADYTRKTQAVAEQQRVYQEREAQLQQRYQQSDEELRTHAQLVNLNSQLEEYSKLSEADWTRLENEDFVNAQQHWRRFQQLQNNYAATSQQLNQMQTARSEQAQQDTARRVQETREYAQKNIKGWSPQMDESILSFATDVLGLDLRLVAQHLNGPIYQGLYYGWAGHQALSKQPAKTPQPKPEPLQTVQAKANPPARKDYASMDMDEYVRARNGGRR
jgi:hypothetical protein